MKNLILIIGLILNFNLYSQIEVETLDKPELVYSHTMGFHSIYKYLDADSVENYGLVFRDCQYQQIVVNNSIAFPSKEDLILFFKIINQVIENKEDKILTFAGQSINILYFNRNAKVYVGDSFCWFSTKWVQKCLDSL